MLYLEFYSQYVHRYIKDNNIGGVEEIYSLNIYMFEPTRSADDTAGHIAVLVIPKRLENSYQNTDSSLR